MIEYILSSFCLLVLTIALLSLAFISWRIARQTFDVPVVADVIFFFVSVKLAFYYALPTVLRIASNYQFEAEDGVPVSQLISVYAIELISWFVWIAVLLAVFSITRTGKRVEIDDLVRRRYVESKYLLVILAVGFVATALMFAVRAEFPAVVEVFKALCGYAGVTAGPVLLVLGRRYYNRGIFWFGAACSLFTPLAFASRGATFYMAVFIVFLLWFVLKDAKAKSWSIGLTLVLVGFYGVFGALLQGKLAVDQSGDLAVNARVGDTGARSSMGEIEWRFGASTRIGTAFLTLYDRGEAAGINPIKHSLMGFLPRSLDPDKPHPSTLYPHDSYSQGMYLIFREIHGYNTFSMTEFPTGAHFYWEFGIPGVLLLSAVSALYVGLCAHFFSKLGIVALPLMVAIFKPWGYTDPKIWVSDIAIQIYQVILPLLALLLAIHLTGAGYRLVRAFVQTALQPAAAPLEGKVDVRVSP